MASRENFPNPPLRLVSFELRFPILRRIATRGVWDAFEEVLANDLPDVELLVGKEDESELPSDSSQPVLRRRTARRDWAVTLRYGGLTVETTAYSSYEKMRAIITAAVAALRPVVSVASVTRLGLRYINEVRVPGIKGRIADWKPYVNPVLLAATEDRPPGLVTSWLEGGLGFHSERGGEHTYLGFGPLPSSWIEPDGVLQLREMTDPCFLLDIDSFLGKPARSPIATTEEEILSAVDRLHDSVEDVFIWSITERLREAVLRVPFPKDHEGKSLTSGGSRV
jgi:uncharacterized protein (TIGR04255 family)